MPTESPVPKDDPLLKAWGQYKTTEDYANTRNWALHEPHVDGSLWAAFSHGWLLAKQERDLGECRSCRCVIVRPDECPYCGEDNPLVDSPSVTR
jgi:hypothetical protein